MLLFLSIDVFCEDNSINADQAEDVGRNLQISLMINTIRINFPQSLR